MGRIRGQGHGSASPIIHLDDAAPPAWRVGVLGRRISAHGFERPRPVAASPSSPSRRLAPDIEGGRCRVSLKGKRPVLLLTTTGRRSGQPRTTPLFYVRDEDALVVCNVRPSSERPSCPLTPDATSRVLCLEGEGDGAGRTPQSVLLHPETAEQDAPLRVDLDVLHARGRLRSGS